MNMFKELDSYFPCAPNRASGEVVSVSISTWGLSEPFANSERDAVISQKRKAWYVNASVNAFHMHRSLVKDASSLMNYHGLSSTLQSRAKKLIAVAVACAYCENNVRDTQCNEFALWFDLTETLSVSLWIPTRKSLAPESDTIEWREVTMNGIFDLPCVNVVDSLIWAYGLRKLTQE